MSGLPNVVKAALVGGGLDVATSQQVPPLGRGGREGGRILNVNTRQKHAQEIQFCVWFGKGSAHCLSAAIVAPYSTLLALSVS